MAQAETAHSHPSAAKVVITEEQRQHIQEMLEDLRNSLINVNFEKEKLKEHSQNQHIYQDVNALQVAQQQLASKSKDKSIDIVFWARITHILSTVNLFLNPKIHCTW